MSQLPVLNAPAAEASAKRTLAPRRKTRQIRLGNVLIGGGAPITVQSMTKTETADVEATLWQIRDMIMAGCEIVRVTANTIEAADVFDKLVAGSSVPVIAVVDRRDVDRFPWEDVADEVVFPGAPEGEIRLRFAMARRRTGGGHEATIRLGPLSLDPGTFRVSLEGAPLDLTFKEFELLRFLAEHQGRVFTRPALMREVWGYDFYGGTRTVDVHVRRLRAKLGPAHEGLIETVRGVGYRAADL